MINNIAPVAEAFQDSDLAVAEFETIIRTWKGEAVGQQGNTPLSPVGEANLDGSRALGQSDTDEIYARCKSYTYWDTSDCGPGSTYGDCAPITIDLGCTVVCD